MFRKYVNYMLLNNVLNLILIQKINYFDFCFVFELVI